MSRGVAATPAISSFALQELLVEYANIKTLCPSGVYVATSPTTPQIWYGVIFVRKGPYAGGIFRFMLFFPDSYPASLPILKLLSPLASHPLVNPLTSEFDFSYAEKSEEEMLLYDEAERESPFRWNGRVFVGRVLSYFKRSFKSGGLGEIPGLYQRDPERFKALAAQDVAQSRATHALFDEDENGDPYAGDEASMAMNLVSEENTLRFARLDDGPAFARQLSTSPGSGSPTAEIGAPQYSVRSTMGETGRGIWEILEQEVGSAA
ncbi:ubiquitin-conjugating enzyme/RWD-like protein [Myxozyma melibiosi]|uniref:Ubiquitin-conjugating enzyme/RWD-like protein n=1 Tax=Myxozyma melibiosi TaxID=54550 RepID=A0ABR1F133_9ASCO